MLNFSEPQLPYLSKGIGVVPTPEGSWEERVGYYEAAGPVSGILNFLSKQI